MAQLFADAARAYLSAGITAGNTTISISSGGALFPVANGTDWFKAVLQDASGIEIVYVTAHTSGANTFTVTRGKEGTTARSFAASSVFGIRVTATDLSDISTKLSGIATGATANATDAALRDRTTHTGTQAISTVTGLQTALDGKEAAYAVGTTAQYLRGDKTWRNFATDVLAAVLTGLSTATSTAAAATDTVLVAIGKLQAQVNARQATLVSGTNIKTVNSTSLLGSGDIVISGGVSADTGFDTVGSFCLARNKNGGLGRISPGLTVAGTSLRPGAFNGTTFMDNSGTGGPLLTGTWRSMGDTPADATNYYVLFQRIA